MFLARAKKKDSDELVKGWYVFDVEWGKHYIYNSTDFTRGAFYVLGRHEIDRTTLAYDTGQTDIKDKSIFGAVEGSSGGDKIKAIDSVNLERGLDAEYIGYVAWSQKSAAWVIVDDGEFIEMLCRAELPEIIGNGLEKKDG